MRGHCLCGCMDLLLLYTPPAVMLLMRSPHRVCTRCGAQASTACPKPRRPPAPLPHVYASPLRVTNAARRIPTATCPSYTLFTFQGLNLVSCFLFGPKIELNPSPISDKPVLLSRSSGVFGRGTCGGEKQTW